MRMGIAQVFGWSLIRYAEGLPLLKQRRRDAWLGYF
jgi:hypothetical protein